MGFTEFITLVERLGLPVGLLALLIVFFYKGVWPMLQRQQEFTQKLLLEQLESNQKAREQEMEAHQSARERAMQAFLAALDRRDQMAAQASESWIKAMEQSVKAHEDIARVVARIGDRILGEQQIRDERQENYRERRRN